MSEDTRQRELARVATAPPDVRQALARVRDYLRTRRAGEASTESTDEAFMAERALRQLERRLEQLSATQTALRLQNASLRAERRRLAGERQRYRDLFEQAPGASLVTDEDDVIREVNRAATGLFARPAVELVGRAIRDLGVTGIDAEAGPAWADRAATVGPLGIGHAVTMTRADGRAVTCSVEVSPWHDAAGRVKGGRWTLRDISAQARACEAVARSEARFRMMAEISTDMISRHAPDGTYRYASPAARSLLGVEPSELVGVSAFSNLHADDLPEARRLLERFAEGESDAETIVFRKRRGDGTYLWVESSIRAIRGDGGELRELQCASRDITGREQAEHALKLIRAAVEQIDEAVVVTEGAFEPPGPRIVFVNPAFERMTGYDADEVLGKTPRMLQGPATDRRELDRLRRALAAGESFMGETINYRKDGEAYVVQWHVAPVRQEEAGPITHWVAIQRDVTRQRAAERQARQHETELAHVARLSTMGELASGLAHELNQPLAAISNYAQGCKLRLGQHTGPVGEAPATRPDAAWLADGIDQIARQADRAGRIIRRMRGFVDKREPMREWVDLNELIEEVLELCRHELQAAGVMVRRRLDEGLPAVPGDRIQIEQVLVNLVQNAVEAMRDHGVDRPVLIIDTEPVGAGVRARVTDNGPGLTDEQLDRLFEPFFTTKGQGMGVGLNISQSIVQSHAGELWATRNAQRGVTFHLTLPGVGEAATDAWGPEAGRVARER